MTKLIWLSDLHHSSEEPVCGVDTHERISVVKRYISRHYSEAAGCVLSGDLVNRGSDDDYKGLASLLTDLPMQVYPMVGNHDDRALMKRYLHVPSDAMTDFVQYEVELGDLSILCLDTQKSGADEGAFCAERADWLEAKLSRNPGRPTLVFTHHPPLELGLPMQDQDCLKDEGRLLDVLSRHDHVRYLCCGHVHRPTSGIVNSIPFATLRSVTYQAPPPKPDWTWDSFAPATEAPQLAVLSWSKTGVTIQYHDFCPAI